MFEARPIKLRRFTLGFFVSYTSIWQIPPSILSAAYTSQNELELILEIIFLGQNHMETVVMFMLNQVSLFISW